MLYLDILKDLARNPIFLAALGSLTAAVAALLAVRTARAAMRMQIILDFAKRDASTELGIATKQLYEFRDKEPSTLVTRFAQMRDNANRSVADKVAWEEIDNARRIVHKFWLQLMQTRYAGLISDDEIITCFVKSQLETVVYILDPLEQAKPGAAFTAVLFDHYKELLKDYDRRFRKVFNESPRYQARS